MKKRPVVIVDPLSSGIELAPTFRQRGIPSIAITLNQKEWPEFGSRIRESDFIEIIPNQIGIENLIKKYDPIAIIPGTEEGIELAERLTFELIPHFSNDFSKFKYRNHKALMQKALMDAGVPALKTFHTSSLEEADLWIQKNELTQTPLIMKPPNSSGSEMVYHINYHDNWKKVFMKILTEPSVVISGKKNDTVVIQEKAFGVEYAVGTVSRNGQHYLSHLIKYNKTISDDGNSIYDYVEFVPFEESNLGELFQYTKDVLNALGVRWGATHTEIMHTNNGPRLIESSTRMIGGPVVGFSRVAYGSSQPDKLVEIYIDGNVREKDLILKKYVTPVFLRVNNDGILTNPEVFDKATHLKTFLSKHLWFKKGDFTSKTVDYLTSIGIIALVGDSDSISTDYNIIRDLESKLIISPIQLENM